MPFTSDLQGMPVIDSFPEHTDPTKGRGLILRDWTAIPRGAIPHCKPDAPRLYSDKEIRERVEEKERTGKRTMDICDANGMPMLDQAFTNYCWFYAVVKALMIQRMRQQEDLIELSPESGAGPATNYANAHPAQGQPLGVGGFGAKSIRWSVEEGFAPKTLWTPHKISPQMDTQEVAEARPFFRGHEFYDLGRDVLQAIFSLVVMEDTPVALGVDDWGHEILIVDACIDPRTHDLCGIFDNSWGLGFGKKGRGVLVPSRMRGDGVGVATVRGGRWPGLGKYIAKTTQAV